jgi:hypothetical protein
LTGKPSIGRYEAIARFMSRFDLVLTYNWGAMDAVMAGRAFAKRMPPIVHHEDGFNADEADGLKPQRNMYRRVALGAVKALAVPSETLEEIALKTWKQPRARVHRIPNGIAVDRYAKPPKPDAIPGFSRKKGEVVIGTLAGLREVKNLPMLVRADAGLDRVARTELVGHRRNDRVPRGIAERIHQPHRTRFLAAEREGRVDVQDVNRHDAAPLSRQIARRHAPID